ncbi:hypothetical protein [Pseudomonas xanthosomatis]|uniref:hypothetical protein n=1 Tax=Pseudomonas xanthosomatis TaxID=2842356 RepID=UPI003512791B
MAPLFDFYAPVKLPDGRWIYGVAAANWRIAQAGGFNHFSMMLVATAYQQAVKSMQRR